MPHILEELRAYVADPDSPDLSVRQLVVLAQVRHYNGTVRGLAVTLCVPKPSITRAVDRLSEYGLAARKADPADRRSVFVVATSRGRKFLDKHFKSEVVASVAIAAMLWCSPAHAWNNTNSGPGPKQIVDGGPGAQATSRASAGAAAVSGSRSTGGNANVSISNTVGGGAGAGVGGGSGDGWGHMPVATAVAPSFYGASPCTGGSAGVAGQAPVFGLSFGGQQMDVSCQALRAEGSPIAMAVLCRDSREYRAARSDIGQPCAQDRPQAPVVQAVAVTPVQPMRRPDWCLTASQAERARHVECR